MLAGVGTGGALCALVVFLCSGGSQDVAKLVVYPSLVVIPFLMGFVAAVVWRPLKLGVGATALHTLLCTLLAILGGWAVFHEGVICLLIVSPLLYVSLFAGALVARVFFLNNRNKLHVFAVPAVLMLFAVGEPYVRSDRTAVETDEILIHAPPEKVWPHVTEFPEIKDAPRFWLFNLGLPMPVATTKEGDFAGAPRRCIFSGGAVFSEKVAEIEPGKKLVFDIVEQPKDPELVGHLTAQRGEFELQDNHDGTTTLKGSTWYALHVRPLWYFDWWARYIFSAVHLRVMENVREMSERGG